MALLSASSLNNRFVHLVTFVACLLGIVWFLMPHDKVAQHLGSVPGRLTSLPERLTSIPGLSPALPNIASSADNPPAAIPPAEKPLAERPSAQKPTKPSVSKYPPKSNHPIDGLIEEAEAEFKRLVSSESRTLHDAAEAYRTRRGRQPPPAFNMWFNFAKNSSALIVEEFFDQIYHDLNPFWGMSPRLIREQASEFPHKISVRNGIAKWKSDIQDRPWMHLWTDLIQTIQDFLPDVDLPINVMDESRIVVPWEDVNWYMQRATKTQRIVPNEELKTRYETLKKVDAHYHDHFDPVFTGQPPYWTLAVVGCPPDSAARKAYIETDFRPAPNLSDTYPQGSEQGYVKNFTLARSPCQNAELQGLHGSFVEPVSISTSKKLFALFGGSKLPMNNDILLPPAMYWTADPLYSGGEHHGGSWAEKQNGMIWRGAASGGRNREENWTRFQRHRFVSMVNATNVQLAESSGQKPINFVLPSKDVYDLRARSQSGTMSEWISTWSDAKFVDLICFPSPAEGDKHLCDYNNHYYTVAESMPMEEQYDYKYLPDIDGNSFSGRYRGFLGSTSLPIKATIYQEWHDSRLVPWRHFVPMDNTFIDIYGIMEYFIGDEKRKIGGHDANAERIATAGKEWAERVLRREDMQIYVLRLLLEYARLLDDDREVMGWNEEASGDR